MENLYQDFNDIAAFRLIYIREAHAADSNWPVGYAEKMGITEHKDHEERRSVCNRLLTDKQLTVPTVVDSFDNAVNEAYNGSPTRVYLVRSDGTLGVVAAEGPWGYEPGLKAVREWLAEYRDTGVEK